MKSPVDLRKRILRPISVVAALGFSVAVVLIGCASTPSGAVESTDGSEFKADAVEMVATAPWGDAVQTAEFTPAVVEQGVECIEVSLPYGETAVLYHFEGLEPNEPVRFRMNVNIDTFMTDSFFEIGILPGIVGMDKAVHPRDLLDEYLAYKWIDSTGRFAGEPYPDATEGWELLETTEYSADENGAVTIMMIINHWTETPPVVYHYFTNPEIRSVGDNSQ